MNAREIEGTMPALRAFARRLTRDADEAADLVQDTVMKAFQGKGGFDGENLRAWLFTIMRNHHINVRRRAAFRRENEARMSASSTGVWAAVRPVQPDSGWEGRDARRAMETLSPERRRAVQDLVDGRSYKEIAARAGVPIGTVMSRLHRARADFERAMP